MCSRHLNSGLIGYGAGSNVWHERHSECRLILPSSVKLDHIETQQLFSEQQGL